MNVENQGMKESDVCNAIGWGLIVLGVISGFIFILVLGRVEAPRTYSGTETVWSGLMVITGIGIVFNGFLVGYLIQKVASILRYHENKVTS
ncbi:hypothetical protein ACOUV0_11385 [Acinetobacter baumannii]|nr:hypothetical protein [Acinetobacter baumannii]